MKLIVMVTLLLSDADVFFTFASFHSYVQAGFVLGPIIITVFTLVYLAGAMMGKQQAEKFCKRLSERVQEGVFVKRNGVVVQMDDVRNYSEEKFRGFMIREGMGDRFFSERSEFIRNLVKWKHSIPFMRLARFGWMPDIPAGDFAGVLNANALYSFTIGFPQLGCTIFSMAMQNEIDLVLVTSLGISCLSAVLSMLNIALSFPKVLNDIEKERMYEAQRIKDLDALVQPHILGLQQECERQVAPLRGKFEHQAEMIRIMREFEVAKEQWREETRTIYDRDRNRDTKIH